MKKVQNTLVYFIAFLPPSIALFLYGYLGNFTRYLADDYCSVYYVKKLGLIGSTYYWYRTWSGGYSSFGVDWLILNTFDAYHIHLIPPISLAIWVILVTLTIYVFLRSLKAQKSTFWSALLLATVAIFLVLLLSPNIQQSLYWWGGMRAYTLPLIVLTFGAYAFFLVSRRIETKKEIYIGTFLSFSFAFVLGGISEAFIVLQISLLLLLIFFKLIDFKKTKLDKDLILFLSAMLGTLLSLTIILSSPGNDIRRSKVSSAPSLLSLLTVSLESVARFINNFAHQKYEVLALIGAILIAIWIGKEYKNEIKTPLWKILAFFISGLLFFFGGFLAGVYGYVQYPPTRTLIIPVFFLVVSFLYASFLLGSWLAQRKKLPYKGIIIAIFAALFLATSATATAKTLYESRHIYINFANKWDRVDAEILEAKAAGAPSVTTEGMDNWAHLDRPNENPKWWPTQCYSLYYDFLVMGPPYW